MTKLFIYIITLCIVTGCDCQKDISQEPRFRDFATNQIMTKKDLRLYACSHSTGTKILHDLTTVDKGDKNLIGVVPLGAPVKLQKIIQGHQVGIVWKEFHGEIQYKKSCLSVSLRSWNKCLSGQVEAFV